jgi:transposase
MRAYSLELRKKIVDAVLGRGVSKGVVARTFGVGLSSVKGYVKMAQQGGSLTPGKPPGRESKLDQCGMKLVKEDLHARPALTYNKRAEVLEGVLGVRVSKSTICWAFAAWVTPEKMERGCE